MSDSSTERSWVSPVKAGLILSAIVVFGFAMMATQYRCILLPSGALECRSNLAWFMDSRPNEIGDALAGFAGTLAFIWIVVTVWLQSIELSEQRQELKKQREEFSKTNSLMEFQRFENTYFSMLSVLGEIVNSIDLYNSDSQQTTRGRDCFNVFYTRLTKAYREKRSKGHSDVDSLEMAYKAFWNDHQRELGHYFRLLYNIFRFLAESEHSKQFHGKLVRSQLSDQELLILHYNCLSDKGRPFIKYVEQFELFDNLPPVALIEAQHAELLPRACFGSNLMLKPSDMKHSINKPKQQEA